MKRKIIVLVVLIAAGTAAWWFWGRSGNGLGVSGDSLRLSGHFEATQTDLSFKVPGKVWEIKVQEGDSVTSGQLVAGLEDQDLRQEVDVAAARVKVAEANLSKMKAGNRPQELEDAQANLAQTRTDLTDRQRDLARQQELVKRGAAAQAALDKALLARDLSRQTLQRAEARLSLVREGFRQEDIAAAAAELEYARATLALARTRLSYATLTSPVAGVVLVRDAEPGQVAAIGSPVVTLGDLDGIWLEVYLPETELPKVRLGQKTQVFTDAWPNQAFSGRITYIAAKAEFTPKTVQTQKERVTLVFRTKIQVDNPEHRLRPGMPGEATVSLAQPPAAGDAR